MRRRDLLLLVAAAAATGARAARADETPHRIGVLLAGQPRSSSSEIAFEKRMNELGYVDGRNLAIIFREAQGHAERLADLAAELVEQRPEVIVAVGPEASLRAVHAATTSIPIVMVAIDFDPIARGYATNLARPGGNITGIFAQQVELAPKRLELLAQLLPAVKRIGVLSDEFTVDQLGAAEKEAAHLGLELEPVYLRNAPYDFTSALMELRNRGVGAVLTLMSPVFFRQRVALADGLLQASLPG